MRVLLLTASPKSDRSTSRVLATELTRRLEARGATVDTAMAIKVIRKPESTSAFFEQMDAADLTVIVSPLYVDALPAPVTRLMELAAERRATTGRSLAGSLALIIQCGFPEAFQCQAGVAIARFFAKSEGLHWAGALQMGMGDALVKGFDKVSGGGGRKQLQALDLAADALAAGHDIPEEAVALFAKPLMPQLLYTLTSEQTWKSRMKESRAAHPIGYRAFPWRTK